MHAKSTGGNSSPLGRKRFSLQSVQERPEAGWMRHPLRTSLGRSAWTRTGHSSSWIIGTIIPATVSQSRACTAALSLDVLPARHLSSAPCASAAGRQRSSLEAAKFCDKLVPASPRQGQDRCGQPARRRARQGVRLPPFKHAQSSSRKVCAGQLRRAP